jgi:hypothetical protein
VKTGMDMNERCVEATARKPKAYKGHLDFMVFTFHSISPEGLSGCYN